MIFKNCPLRSFLLSVQLCKDAQEWRECVSFYRKLMSSFLQLPSLSPVCQLDILDLLQMLILGLPELHLVGGSGPHEGNILVGGRPVCDDGHNVQNALVVCRFPFYLGAMISNRPLKMMITSKTSKCHHPPRMLGYPSGLPTHWSHFGAVAPNFAMDNVQCLGNETSLLDCPHLKVCDSYNQSLVSFMTGLW